MEIFDEVKVILSTQMQKSIQKTIHKPTERHPTILFDFSVEEFFAAQLNALSNKDIQVSSQQLRTLPEPIEDTWISFTNENPHDLPEAITQIYPHREFANFPLQEVRERFFSKELVPEQMHDVISAMNKILIDVGHLLKKNGVSLKSFSSDEQELIKKECSVLIYVCREGGVFTEKRIIFLHEFADVVNLYDFVISCIDEPGIPEDLDKQTFMDRYATNINLTEITSAPKLRQMLKKDEDDSQYIIANHRLWIVGSNFARFWKIVPSTTTGYFHIDSVNDSKRLSRNKGLLKMMRDYLTHQLGSDIVQKLTAQDDSVSFLVDLCMAQSIEYMKKIYAPEITEEENP